MSLWRDDDELGAAIAKVDAPAPREAFRTGLRSVLLEAAATEWTPRREARPRPSFAFAWRFALAAFAILAVGLGATGAAAAASLPGDAAYPVKLALEQVELTFATDEAAKVEVLARQADRRLSELNAVADKRPESAPTAAAAYQLTVQQFQAAVDALKAAEPGEKHDEALDVAEAAGDKHVAVLEELNARNDAPGLEKALEQAKELERHTGRHEDADKKDEQRKDDERTSPTTGPTRPATPRPATPRPATTPRPTERPETPKPSGSD